MSFFRLLGSSCSLFNKRFLGHAPANFVEFRYKNESFGAMMSKKQWKSPSFFEKDVVEIHYTQYYL